VENPRKAGTSARRKCLGFRTGKTPKHPPSGEVQGRRAETRGAVGQPKVPKDEDEKLKRVGTLEREKPIFLRTETLEHRGTFVSAHVVRSAREEA
jgi:hypothetical protein